ncbi:MAG TPA: hypothetical protein VI030_14580 [Propionibacteriaceae bacterium]
MVALRLTGLRLVVVLVAKRVLAQRYFTINWIQLAVTWAAFALFILALSFL